jgi:uncharacterized membrane protein HdeD (DUF308 family)
MLQTILKNWWVLTLKGVLLVIFGIIAFMNPGVTFAILLTWFSAFLIIDGILSLVTVASNWKIQEDKWLFVLEGVVNILLGVLIFRAPAAYTLVAVFFMGFWSIFSGISRIAMAIQLRKEITGEGWLALSGVLGVVFGIIIISNPAIGVATFMYMLAFFAIAVGVLLMLLSFKVKNAKTWAGAKKEELKSAISEFKSRQ